ncbi:MAG: TIR domain-containing protein, partial [Saprospiraceae bacterium]
MPEPAIFISYRIADTQVEARLLFTDLSNHFGEGIAFLDKKGLDAGVDWPDELSAKVQNAKVLLVLIKDESKWLGVNRHGVRRMDDPKDWVRLEIETALAEEKTVIPVLVDGAMLPPKEVLPTTLHDFLRKQDRKVATEKWDSDIAALLADLEKTIPRKKPGAATAVVHPLSEYPLPANVPDPLDHHPAPFLGLPFFSRSAARLFFGRSREILEFFSLVENPEIRLISLFGHSGVGKSSFLAAGIRPRLETARTPHYERREKTKGLGKQLAQLRQQPKTPGKPPVYILDQVEEIFTDLLPGEREDFVQSLRAAVQEEKDATIVLGFRSDFQLDVSDLLARVDCRQEDLPLRPLGHAALVEAIEGVWRDPVLAKRYALELEKGFADFVARDLMHSESGGAAAILQNRLLKLYDQAKASRTPADPLIDLRIADYEELSRNAVAEEELLDFQILRLREAAGKDSPDEKTILETLDRFVLDKPTAGTLSKSSLPEDPKKLRDALRRVNLLTEIPESQAIRLSHDLLAPIVRRRYSQFLLDSTQRAEIEAVQLRLRQVRAYLVDLDFANALLEFKMASPRHTLPEEVWPFAFELAFVFLQARKREDGVYALLKCVTFMEFAGILFPPYPDKSFPDKHDFPELLEYLRRCDPALFIKMERRYFPTMIRVEGGTFEMGDVLEDKEEKDETVHTVTLSDYELAETPLTWQQYGLYCLATEREVPNDSGFGRGERPVLNVSWYDAV